MTAVLLTTSMWREDRFPARSSDTTESLDIPGGAATPKEKLPSADGLAWDVRRSWIDTETRHSSDSVCPDTAIVDVTSSPSFGEKTVRLGGFVSTTTIPLLNS